MKNIEYIIVFTCFSFLFLKLFLNKAKNAILKNIYVIMLFLLIMGIFFSVIFKEEIGDIKTITPFVETSLLLMGAVATFMAFFVQYQYNEKQKNDLDNERNENNIFHFINNLDRISKDININNIGNDKCAFHFIFYEIKALYYIFITYFFTMLNNKKTKVDRDSYFSKYEEFNKLLIKVCVSIILSGITKTSNEQIKSRVLSLFEQGTKNYKIISKHIDKLICIVNYLQSINRKDLDCFMKQELLTLYVDYANVELLEKKKVPWFYGHRQNLVRYVKYIFMIIKYIDGISIDFKCDKEKEGIIKKMKTNFFEAIFCQMSEHEIGVLNILVNSNHEFAGMLGLDEENPDLATMRKVVKEWMSRTNDMYDYTNTTYWKITEISKIEDIVLKFSKIDSLDEYLKKSYDERSKSQ